MSDLKKKSRQTKVEEVELWRRRLREVLDARGLEYDKVSEAAGNAPEYVSRVLSGRFNPTVARLMKICEVANIDMAYLFSERVSDEDRSVIEKASDLSDRDAQLVSRLIQSARSK